MRRRDVLRAAGGTLALGALGTPASAHVGPYRPLGTVDIEGAKEVVVGDDGSVAYVAATDGFATVDVGSAWQPEVLAEERDILDDEENGPLEEIYDVKVEGDRLVAAGPANAIGDALLGVAVYDVSDPASPEFVAFHETDFPIHNCFLDDGIVYLTGNDREKNPLVMVDVSGDDPEEVGRWSIVDHDEAWAEVDWYLRVLHDVWVQDGTAYLVHWDAGTWIVDVSDPQNPEYVSNFRGGRFDELLEIDDQPSVQTEATQLPGNDHYAMVNDDASVIAVGEEAWDVPETDEETSPGGIELWNVENPESPERLSRIEAPPSPNPTMGGTWTTSHNFDLVGDRLYTSWYQGGVKVFDVSDPANPEELAWWRSPDRTAFWTAKLAVPTDDSGEGFFVASSYGVSPGIEEGLYTFPDESGQQKDPPSLSPTPGESDGTPADGTPTPTETPADAAGQRETAATSGQPGFGALAGLAGLVGGAWWLTRDDEE